MGILRIVLIALLVLTVLITGASFFVAHRASRAPSGDVSLTAAKIAYSEAEKYMKYGDSKKAGEALAIIVKRYPGSEYAKKSLRQLIDFYIAQKNGAMAAHYYEMLLKDFPGTEDLSVLKKTIEDINMQVMLAPETMEGKTEYTVRSGDTLIAIARKFNTTVALIKKMNGLERDMLMPGQKLKIDTSEFSIFIDKSDNILALKRSGEVFKTYRVATGKDNSTPEGTFTIVDKIVKPPWTNAEGKVILPDSEQYELGERWMAISEPGYGIHGTNDEASIGKHVTGGCIRMYNADVIELYDIVPKGTKVEIVE